MKIINQSLSSRPRRGLEDSINKKIYYFENISAMKNYNLLPGDYAIVEGYYSAGDGGKASYEIIEDNSLTEDGGAVHHISGNIFAILIIENNEVSIKQLGGRSIDATQTKYDIAAAINRYNNILNIYGEKVRLHIPGGGYYCSTVDLINDKGFSIIGDESFDLFRCTGTVISTYSNNQNYIFNIGDSEHNVKSWVLKNICFTSANITYEDNTKKIRFNSTIKNVNNQLINIDNASFGLLDNIFFNYIKGQAIAITNSWENYFTLLNFRNISNYGSAIMEFTPISNVEHSNVSACTFENLMFESIHGDCIKLDKGSNVGNCVFNNINFEDYALDFDGATNTTFTDEIIAEFDEDAAIHNSIFNIAAPCEFIVNNLFLNNFSWRYSELDNQQYTFDTIFNITDSDTELCCTLNNLHITGMKKNGRIIKQDADYAEMRNETYFKLNNILLNETNKNLYYDVHGFRKIVSTDNLKGRLNYDGYDYSLKFNYDTNKRSRAAYGTLYYDEDAINPLNIVTKLHDTVDYKSTTANNFNIAGDILYLRLRIPANTNVVVSLVNNDGSKYKNVTMTGTGDYDYYTIEDLLNTFSFGEEVGLRLDSTSALEEVYFDVYKFIDNNSSSTIEIVDNLTTNNSTKALSAKQGKVLKDLTDKKPYYFDTVAAMKANTNLKVGDYVITKGYYSSHDGGNGEYTIVNDNNLVDDGGSIHELTNGLFAKLIVKNNTINILQFGAKSDVNNFDNTPIINKCLDKYIKVIIPEGNFYINTKITLPFNKQLVGISPNKSILLVNNGLSNEYAIQYGTTYQYTAKDGVIKNISIKSGVTNSHLSYGVYLYSGINIENCNFFELKRAITQDNHYIDRIKLINCNVNYCYDINNNQHVIYLPGNKDELLIDTLTINDNYINTGDTTNALYFNEYRGIYISQTTEALIENSILNTALIINDAAAISVNNCHFEGSQNENYKGNLGYIQINKSNISINDCYLHKRINGANILVKRLSNDENSHSFVYLNNIMFANTNQNIQYIGETNYTNYEIEKDTNTILKINGCYKITDFSSSWTSTKSLNGIFIKDNDKFNTHSSLYSISSIVNTSNNVIQNIPQTSSTIVNDNMFLFSGANANVPFYQESMNDTPQYFTGIYVIDEDRKLALAKNTTEQNVNVTTNSKGILLNYRLIDTESTGGILYYYRGNSTGSYNKLTKIPLVSTQKLFDMGNNVSGYLTTDRTAGNIDTFTYVSKYSKDGDNVVFYSSSYPTSGGTFKKGDKCINSGNSGTPAWIYNGTEWTAQTIPTKTSDLTNDSGFIIGSSLTIQDISADTELKDLASGTYVAKYDLTLSALTYYDDSNTTNNEYEEISVSKGDIIMVSRANGTQHHGYVVGDKYKIINIDKERYLELTQFTDDNTVLEWNKKIVGGASFTYTNGVLSIVAPSTF